MGKTERMRSPCVDTMAERVFDLPTGEENRRIVATCMNAHDRAMLLIRYLGGFQKGDIRFDGHGAVITRISIPISHGISARW